MPNTPRMRWTFPSENQKPFYDAIEDFFGQQDASGYAAREDRHIILSGGGTISFSSGGGLTWTSNIEMLAAITGFNWRIAPQAGLSIADGEILYVDLVRAPSNNVTLTPQVASQVPSTDAAHVLAVRRGSVLHFVNGTGITSGSSVSGLGGDTVTTFRQAFNAEVTGTTFENVGSLYLPEGTLQTPARIYAGATTVAPDAAEVELRRETGATLIASWTVTGLLDEDTLPSPVSIPADDWYSIRVRGNDVAVVALLRGIDWVVL